MVASRWCPLLELDVRGAYACLTLTMLPKQWPHVRKGATPYLEWPRRFPTDDRWSWNEVFRAASCLASRARCLLWWRILHNRWNSNERARSWDPGETGLCPHGCGVLGSTAHVFVECREAVAVWHWLACLWRRITDDGELRCDARAVLSGFALPVVRSWRPLRRLRLALYTECLGAIADSNHAARRVRRELGNPEFLPKPQQLAVRAVRLRVRQEFESASVLGERALEKFATLWQVGEVICSVGVDGALEVVIS